MVTKVDHFGRVVIPKTIRSDLGLKPGTIVDIGATENGVLIHVSQKAPFMKTKEGALIYTGEIIGEIEAFVKKDREERIKFLNGL